jgi:diguanylate cyclase (GGDEF)-like protein
MSPEVALPKQLPQDRRRPASISAEVEEGRRSLFDVLAIFIRKFRLQDIISTRHHSDDFVETRARYIAVRLRYMAIFYAIAVPLWIPVDYMLLRPEHFSAMVVPKLLLTAFLLPLGLLTLRNRASNQIHTIFALVFIAADMFYFASMWILGHGSAEPMLAGYSLMPFMLISMLGVFPLTLAWGVAMSAIIIFFYLALEVSLGQLMTIETANMLWVLFILAGVSLWVQSSQLLMLLKLYRESTRDPLTGMINRRVLMRRLTTEIAHRKEDGSSFCILMFDLDRFKRVNDNYGHLIGDEVLKTTADILQKSLREHDIVARFGGEEFVAVLPGSRSREAVAVAERIRASCYDTHVTAPNGDRIQLSTSVGVTEYEADEAIEATLNRADESLYEAKELGRNRVVYSQSEGYSGQGG